LLRRGIAVLGLVTVLGGLGQGDVWAHAGLRYSDPVAGATLGDTPTVVKLSFWEKPEPSLSAVTVLDTGGAAYQIGRPERVAGEPLSLAVRVRPLDRGVYIVSWRILSAVDAHTTAGAFAFGVRVTPTGTAAAAASYPAASWLEMLARFTLIVGLVALLGAAAAAVAQFGGTGDLMLGACGWVLAIAGLILLAEAQRRNAAASFADLLRTSVGRALIGRAAAIGAAGGALLVARGARPRIRRAAMQGAALAALLAMVAHVAAGHAAARRFMPAATVGIQWAHFAAVGVWLGGLAALLLGVRGAPSPTKAAAVRSFSRIAAAGLFVVAATGVARTLQEVSSWSGLLSSGYGRAVMGKTALLVAIAVFGAFNRWRSVPAAATSLRPLRWTASGELALAAGALATAAALGALPPPSSGELAEPSVIDVSGADFGTTIRALLTTASDQPGPNRFVVHVVDYDLKTPVRARRVTLGFTPLDDPDVVSTSLPLAPGPGDSYVGSGANLAFDGRWRVTVLVERAGDSVEVPLEVETRSVGQFVSIERVPGQAPKYMVQVTGGEHVRISPDPERAGPSRLFVTCYDVFLEERDIEEIVVTAAAGDGPTRQRPVRRLDRGRFVADVELEAGRNRIAAIARAIDGTRLRAAVDLDVPAR